MVAAAAAAAAAEEEEEEASRGDNGKQREATAAHSNIQHTGDGKSPNSYRGKKKANGSRQPVHHGVPHTHVTWLHDTFNQLPPSATRTNPQYYRGEATNIRRQPRPTHLSTSSGTQSITDDHHHSNRKDRQRPADAAGNVVDPLQGPDGHQHHIQHAGPTLEIPVARYLCRASI